MRLKPEMPNHLVKLYLTASMLSGLKVVKIRTLASRSRSVNNLTHRLTSYPVGRADGGARLGRNVSADATFKRVQPMAKLVTLRLMRQYAQLRRIR